MKRINHLSLMALTIKRMALIILLFTAVSCQQEKLDFSPQANEVTFSLAVDKQAVTRSGSDDPTRYIMEIYTDADGAPAQRIEQATGSFTVMLKESEEYTILFYADYGTAAADTEIGNEYNAADLQELKVQSQPTKPCFAGVESFTYDSEADTKPYLSPVLTHAVSQVNFVQGAEDFIAGANSLTVTIPKTYAYNAMDSTVTEIASVETTFTFTGIAQNSSDQTIAQSYIFANGTAQTVMDDVEITFNSETAKSLDNVPFQANHRTNIKGLYNNTYTSTFTIESEDNWDEDIDKPLGFTGAYTIGSTYPKDGTTIGVVYAITDDTDNDGYGDAGMVVSLDEGTNKNWATAQTWATSHSAGGKTWHCPSKGELLELLSADNTITTVNTALGNMSEESATEISTSPYHYYWSSTENNTYSAWALDIYNHRLTYINKDDLGYYVRAVLAF